MDSNGTQGELNELQQLVRAEIDAYVYEAPRGAVGSPWSVEKVLAGLEDMRSAVVPPYWTEVEIRDTFERCGGEARLLQRCAVVADNQVGTLLLWDPKGREFLLAERRDGRLIKRSTSEQRDGKSGLRSRSPSVSDY
jgi:hypothetical protein